MSHLERAEGCQGASQATGAGDRRECPRQNTGQCKGQKQKGPARHVKELKWGGGLSPSVGSVAGERAECQTAQAPLAPGLGPGCS